MHTVHKNEAERLDLPGRTVFVLAGNDARAKLQSDRMTFGMAEVPPQSAMQPHSHAHEEELILVLQGFGRVVIDGQEEALEPDVLIALPVGSEHYIVNTSKSTMKFAFCFSPCVSIGSYDRK